MSSQPPIMPKQCGESRKLSKYKIYVFVTCLHFDSLIDIIISDVIIAINSRNILRKFVGW
jgi:hypothetical protein